jgi:hypothetical protein
MMRYQWWGGLVVLPLLSVALVSLGCGDNKTDKPVGKAAGSGSGTVGKGDSRGGGGSTAEATPIKATSFGTIKGKVTYVGDPPVRADIAIPDNNKDKSECLKGDHKDPTWIVSADKGVKNAVVWLRAPKGKYFDVPADQQKPADMTKKVDQPFCAFEPHVQILFPSVYDEATKKQKKTGQVFEVVNDASFTHNTNWNPKDSLLDSNGNEILSPKQERKIEVFKSASPSKKGLEQLLSLKCNIHQWMTGYVWAFDHPYAAVTNDDGTYEIKNVPAGEELIIVAWHEPDMYLTKGANKGDAVQPLKANETREIDFTASK